VIIGKRIRETLNTACRKGKGLHAGHIQDSLGSARPKSQSTSGGRMRKRGEGGGGAFPPRVDLQGGSGREMIVEINAETTLTGRKEVTKGCVASQSSSRG